AVERLDHEHLEARNASASRGEEPEVVALERAAIGKLALTAQGDERAMAVDSGPEPTDLEALIRRQLPQSHEALDVRICALDPAEPVRARRSHRPPRRRRQPTAAPRTSRARDRRAPDRQRRDTRARVRADWPRAKGRRA